MVVVVDPADVSLVVESARAARVDAWVLGDVVAGEGRVRL
jgi:hypothetical protein